MAWSMHGTHGKDGRVQEAPGDRWNRPPTFASGQTARINAHRAIELVEVTAEPDGGDNRA